MITHSQHNREVPISRWSRESVQEAILHLEGDLRSDRLKTHDLMGLLLRRIHEVQNGSSTDSHLSLFILIRKLLHLGADVPTFTQKQALKWVRLAEHLLKVQGIRPNHPALSYLYGDLRLFLSQIYKRDGDHWSSAWEQQISTLHWYNSPRENNAPFIIDTARQAERLGHIREALAVLEKHTVLQSPELGLERARLLRVSGEVDRAGEVLQSLPNSRQVRLEQLYGTAIRSRSLKPLLASIRNKQTEISADHLVAFYFLSRILKDKEMLILYPTFSSLKRGRTLNLGKQERMLLQILDNCYNTSLDFSARLQAVGNALGSISKLESIETEILAWAAISRWLFRSRSYDLAGLALKRYESLCLTVSDGKSRDTWGFMNDLVERYSQDHRPAPELQPEEDR